MLSKITLLSILLGVVAIVLNFDFFLNSIRTYLNHDVNSKSKLRLFTKDELKSFNGIDKDILYLAILGQVFDVSKGAKHYGPGQSYHVFVGQDATRCFVTGQFEPESVSDDVIGLNNQELRSLNHWLKFYNKEYTKVGEW